MASRSELNKKGFEIMEQIPQKLPEELKEKLEQLEKLEQAEKERETPQRIQERALHDIDRMWEIVTDTDPATKGLPLSANEAYEYGKEILKNRAEDYARVLFTEARNSVSEERLRNAAALLKLLRLIPREQSERVLEKLLTTKEAIVELLKKGTEELPDKERKKAKRNIDELKHLTF